jgi:hypothetical protein
MGDQVGALQRGLALVRRRFGPLHFETVPHDRRVDAFGGVFAMAPGKARSPPTGAASTIAGR